VIYLIGWAPHESQQKPLSRGSASVSLKDLGLPSESGGSVDLDESLPDLDDMLGRKPPDGGSGSSGGKTKKD